MSATKILFLVFPIFLLGTTLGHSQIITTKKEAVKKGVYEKPSEKKKISPDVEKTLALVEKSKADKTVAPKAVASTEKPKTALQYLRRWTKLQNQSNVFSKKFKHRCLKKLQEILSTLF